MKQQQLQNSPIPYQIISNIQITTFFSGLITDLCWGENVSKCKFYSCEILHERRKYVYIFNEGRQKLRWTACTVFIFTERGKQILRKSRKKQGNRDWRRGDRNIGVASEESRNEVNVDECEDREARDENAKS